ncbi:hypothetical protein WS71_07225 [Burkholderia mayonis]|uniref:histidine kinase n=1 Tax=Burkholderia mayonis TaxID=1385591 RepID=A0A1B4FTX5_9BURK|nr:hypothetical protein WS71_07225 [Burkholderia mayonis]KVE46010.1 hypothetical protein WS71_23350 [Burkholderia mayonis]
MRAHRRRAPGALGASNAPKHAFHANVTKMSCSPHDRSAQPDEPADAQVALSKPRTADEYGDVIESSIDEYQRLSRMIEDMLFLARADKAESHHGKTTAARAASTARRTCARRPGQNPGRNFPRIRLDRARRAMRRSARARSGSRPAQRASRVRRRRQCQRQRATA